MKVTITRSIITALVLIGVFSVANIFDHYYHVGLSQNAHAEDGGAGGGSGDGGSPGGGGDGGGGGGSGAEGAGCCGDPGSPADGGVGGDGNGGGGSDPVITWVPYCTGANDPNPWQWWQYTDDIPGGRQFQFIRPGDGSCVPPPPTWILYCTGGSDSNGNNWQWWQYTDDLPGGRQYQFVRNGDGECVPPPPPPPPLPPLVPVCIIDADLKAVQVGGTYRLSWSTNNATAASLDGGIGSVEVGNGSRTITATAPGTYTYTLTVTGNGQTANCGVTITVEQPPQPLAPVCTLTASPTLVRVGGTYTLSWTAVNAIAGMLDNESVPVSETPNTRTITATTPGTYTYNLTVTGNGQSDNCPVTVVVETAPVPVCALTATPTTITRGGSATLNWSTSNASAATINQGIGDIAINQSGSRVVTPEVTTTYVLTVLDNNGQSAACPQTVIVQDPALPFTCENNVNFSISPDSIDEDDEATIRWTVTGATSVSIDNGVNTNNALTGSATVRPNSDTTYTLTANNGSNTINCQVSINVDEDNGGGGGGGGGSATPRCELTVSDTSIRPGDRITLRWNTSNATRVVLRDNRGDTIITTDGKLSSEKRELYDGSTTVRPDRDTTYTLLAERGSRDRECTVRINVDDNVTVTEIRDQQPLVVSIPLTDVPYTGVDARAAMQMSILGLIVLWGGYLAWSFYRRNKVV